MDLAQAQNWGTAKLAEVVAEQGTARARVSELSDPRALAASRNDKTLRLNQHFSASRVAEKGLRAGTSAIGTRLEHNHQVTLLRHRQLHPVG